MHSVRFDELRRIILEEHEELRARIRGLERNAERVDLPWAQRAIQLLLPRFAARFEAHLAFEERELAPRLRDLDASGPVREAAMRGEHREQRRRVEEVCALAEEPDIEATLLFEAVSELADSLLADIRAEEHTLAQLAQLDEQGHVDQLAG